MNNPPSLTASTLSFHVGAAIMIVRGWIYFLLRFQMPQMVLMDRGARIRGLRNVEFSGRAKLGAFSLVDARNCGHVKLGHNFSLGDYSILRGSGSPSFICPGMTFGDEVSFGPYCNIGGGFGLDVGDFNIFGPYVSIHPEVHVVEAIDVPIRRQGVKGDGISIGVNNWFGAKATVLDGVVVKSGNILAAAALLTRGEYGSNLVFGGVPAREIGKRR